MFRYESEMIPVLVENLSKVFDTEYITTEFATGNGVADVVFSTELNSEKLFLNDYGLMSLYLSLFQDKKALNTLKLHRNCNDRSRLKKLLNRLQVEDYILIDGDTIIQTRKYKSHTQNLFSVEAKLKDWKSGFYQALRYKFFSHKSYLAFPKEYQHRVDLALLKEHNIGLISVDKNRIEFVYQPKTKIPQDLTAYFFLSELFAQEIRSKVITENMVTV